MKRLSLLMIILLIMGVFISGGLALSNQEVDIRDIPKLIAELKEKGLIIKLTGPGDKYSFWLDDHEFITGLLKLNTFMKEDIKKGQIDDAVISIEDYFIDGKKYGEIVIDYQASAKKIRDYVLKYGKATKEAAALEKIAKQQAQELVELVSSKGLNIDIYSHSFINYRQFVIGLKKLSFISEYEIRQADLEGIDIGVSDSFMVITFKAVYIDYRASLEEIKKFLHID